MIDETFEVSVVANTEVANDGDVVLVNLNSDLREERQNWIWIDIVRILSLDLDVEWGWGGKSLLPEDGSATEVIVASVSEDWGCHCGRQIAHNFQSGLVECANTIGGDVCVDLDCLTRVDADDARAREDVWGAISRNHSDVSLIDIEVVVEKLWGAWRQIVLNKRDSALEVIRLLRQSFWQSRNLILQIVLVELKLVNLALQTSVSVLKACNFGLEIVDVILKL